MNDITTRQNDLERFYEQMNRLKTILRKYHYLQDCNGRMEWPKRGVYYFFEEEDYRHDSTQLRVVRVGTHAVSKGAKSTLWSRLRTHRGHMSQAGNHRGSVFRLLVGSALISRGDYPASAVSMWGTGSSAGHDVRMNEKMVEIDVSRYIGSIPFLWVAVDDEPGPQSLRKYIEKNSIALLSNSVGCPDCPSKTWLGFDCQNIKICESGLWNSDHIFDSYNPAFLDILEKYVSLMASSENAPLDKYLEAPTH